MAHQLEHPEHERIILGIARTIVSSHRPAELAFFDLQARQLMDDLREGDRIRRGSDNTLAVGSSTAVELLWPIAIAVGFAAFQFLSSVLKNVASKLVQDKLEAWLKSFGTGDEVHQTTLPPDVIAELRAVIDTTLRERFPGVDVATVKAALLEDLSIGAE